MIAGYCYNVHERPTNIEDTVLVILVLPLHKDYEYFEISHGKSVF